MPRAELSDGKHLAFVFRSVKLRAQNLENNQPRSPYKCILL